MIFKCGELEKIVRRIKDEFAVLPADTLYSLSIGVFSNKAEEIYRIKGRGKEIPIPIGVLDKNMMEEYVEVNSKVIKILNNDWSYLVTFILWNKNIPKTIVGEKVGVRIPKNDILKNVMKVVGPITLTSANKHGGKNPITINDADEALGDLVNIYLDCGPCLGIPSTVVDLTGDKPILIREGAIPFTKIVDLYG